MNLSAIFSAALLLVAGAAACRSTSVCGSEACDAGAPPGAGGQRAAHGAGEAGEMASVGAGAGGAAAPGAGAAGASAAGAAGGAAEPPELACEDGMADCDGSRFTACETELSWTQRHCGACGNVCDGACAFGQCLEAEVLTRDVGATALVSTKSHAYATLERNDCFVGRIELESGELESVLEGLARGSQLALSRDRVYVFDEANEHIYTIPFGANQVATPEQVLRPSSMGASPSGAYYVRYAEYDAEEPADGLWFRLNAADPWQLVASASAMTIVSSSAYGVVLEQELDDGSVHLFDLEGQTLIDHGPAPSELHQAVAIESGIAALGRDDESEPWHLYWLKPDAEATRYALEGKLVDYGTSLFPYGGQVAVLVEDRSRMYLRFFDSTHALRDKLGLASYSLVAALDDTYIWHTTWDSWITQRVLRSTWQSLDVF